MGHGATELQRLRAGVETLEARLTAVEQELQGWAQRSGVTMGKAASASESRARAADAPVTTVVEGREMSVRGGPASARKTAPAGVRAPKPARSAARKRGA